MPPRAKAQQKSVAASTVVQPVVGPPQAGARRSNRNHDRNTPSNSQNSTPVRDTAIAPRAKKAKRTSNKHRLPPVGEVRGVRSDNELAASSGVSNVTQDSEPVTGVTPPVQHIPATPCSAHLRLEWSF